MQPKNNNNNNNSNTNDIKELSTKSLSEIPSAIRKAIENGLKWFDPLWSDHTPMIKLVINLSRGKEK